MAQRRDPLRIEERGVGGVGAAADRRIRTGGECTLIVEGARGSLTKQLIARFALDKDRDPLWYGIGIKRVWQVVPEKHPEGV